MLPKSLELCVEFAGQHRGIWEKAEESEEAEVEEETEVKDDEEKEVEEDKDAEKDDDKKKDDTKDEADVTEEVVKPEVSEEEDPLGDDDFFNWTQLFIIGVSK